MALNTVLPASLYPPRLTGPCPSEAGSQVAGYLGTGQQGHRHLASHISLPAHPPVFICQFRDTEYIKRSLAPRWQSTCYRK